VCEGCLGDGMGATVAGLGGAGAADCGTRCSRWPDTRKMGDVQRVVGRLAGVRSRGGTSAFWGLCAVFCLNATCLSAACLVAACLCFWASLPVWHATDHLGPTRAFRPEERCISTCVSASPACGTGRHRIGRAGCGDAAVQHVCLVCLRHNNTDVQGDHVHTIAVAWVVATAVRGMWRSGRRDEKEEAASLSRCHRQPVSLRRPACLLLPLERDFVLRKAGNDSLVAVSRSLA